MRKRMMKRMGMGGRGVGGMFGSMSSSSMFGDNSLKYYCMSCGAQHKQAACPKCGSKMKRVGSWQCHKHELTRGTAIQQDIRASDMTETLNAFTPEHLIKILGKVPSAELSDALSIISADKIEKTLRVVSRMIL